MNYLAQLYCVCVVWNNLDPNQIVNIKIDFMQMVENYPQTMWLKYEAFKGNQTNIDDLIRMGIDNDCQVNRANLWVHVNVPNPNICDSN